MAKGKSSGNRNNSNNPPKLKDPSPKPNYPAPSKIREPLRKSTQIKTPVSLFSSNGPPNPKSSYNEDSKNKDSKNKSTPPSDSPPSNKLKPTNQKNKTPKDPEEATVVPPKIIASKEPETESPPSEADSPKTPYPNPVTPDEDLNTENPNESHVDELNHPDNFSEKLEIQLLIKEGNEDLLKNFREENKTSKLLLKKLSTPR